MLKTRLIATSLVLLVLGCGGGASTSSGSSGTAVQIPTRMNRPLRVRLFGYIPPYNGPKTNPNYLQHPALGDFLSERFRSASGHDVSIDFGETWMQSDSPYLGRTDDSYDLVEIDVSNLPSLASVVGEWHIDHGAVIPAASVAVRHDERDLAWPTYACGNVVYSFHEALTAVDSLHDLTEMMVGGRLVGDLNGSLTLPPIYSDAYLDRHGSLPTTTELDNDVIGDISRALSLCDPVDHDNRCLNDSYDVYDGQTGAADLFAGGDARALFGYTEFLYYVLEANPNANLGQLRVISAPLSSESHPMMFVDGLVRNRNFEGACEEVALAFARFLTSPEIQASIAFGDDADAQHPRYLIMAQRAFWEHPRVVADPVYRQLREYVLSASNTPYRPSHISKRTILTGLGVPDE